MKAKWVLSFYIIIGLFAVYLAAILPNYNFITLSRSTGGVRVEYLRNYNGEMPRFSSELAHLYTEEEAFEISHSPAFQGKILSIRNIRALFHGESSLFDTFAIANVRVEKVFSGELSAGDTVRILLPCPIARNIWVEHMDIVSQCRTGMRGIFLPQALGDSDFREKDGAILYFSDLADYAFHAGYMDLFLETRDGLVFNQEIYTSLSPDATLEEAGEYVAGRIQSYSII